MAIRTNLHCQIPEPNSLTASRAMARSMVSFSVAAMLVVCSLIGLKPTAVVANGFNYGEALEKSLMFFEAQRSGKLPPDQRVKWRGDSGLKDGFDQGVDLVGGYYDSGDHVKFGLPMAFAVTMLSWSTIEFEKEIATANQLEYALDAIQWGTDYFMKAHKQPDTFWAQVGDGDSDHYCWMRAEDMATPRTAYKVDSEHPGSDIAAETAAAMAAASIAFKPYNSSYSKLLLLHAKQLFSFADTFRGRYDDSIDVARKYYPSSSGYHDELLWAASWLFLATDDQYYLKYVVDNAVSLGGTGWAVREFSWDNKYAGLQVLLSKVLMGGGSETYSSTLKQYQAKAEFFLCACLQMNNDYNVEMTPGGLLYFDEWNNMQYVATASFLLAVYSDLLSMKHAKLECPDSLVQPSELLKFARSQADYILGKNPKSMSYLVGYQLNYPTHVHHRGASIPSIFALPSPIGCVEGYEQWYHRQEGNPNVIMGALVGGPDRQDQFDDDRSNYEKTEPTIAGNAPLIGLFARLASAPGYPGHLPRYSTASPSKATAEVPFEFLQTVTNTWKDKGVYYYRHRVTVKNTCSKPITDLKLQIENLSGAVWGLSPTSEKNIYELPPWIKVVKPGTLFYFVYIQGEAEAKISVVSYN